MVSHANAVREAERRVLDAVGRAYGRHGLEDTADIEHHHDRLVALRAAACAVCNGLGEDYHAGHVPRCPANCNNGRRRDG